MTFGLAITSSHDRRGDAADGAEQDWSAVEALRGNFSLANGAEPRFDWCWTQQTCGGCLHRERCSWCPYTWTCVPNDYEIPLLAPAYNDKVCPHPAERWELRTRPLGCGVSTVTALTALGSVAVTLTALLALGCLLAGLRTLARGRDRYWIVERVLWRDEGSGRGADREREALLSRRRGRA